MEQYKVFWAFMAFFSGLAIVVQVRRYLRMKKEIENNWERRFMDTAGSPRPGFSERQKNLAYGESGKGESQRETFDGRK